jgi:uncharacterized membrane protein YdbT with pleckstrin-like domain
MIALDNDERIIFEVRRHWFVLLTQTLPLIVFIFLPVIARIALEVTGLSNFISIGKHTEQLITIGVALWTLFIWVVFFVIWTSYYLDILILTNKRIIEIEQKALFSREISTFRLDRIQDITVDVNGIIPTFFNFGDIRIQTAGEVPEIRVHSIPRPHHVREIISQEQDNAIERSRIVLVDGTQ